MPSGCYEFVDSRLRRSPPDRAGAGPYGQAGENAMRFPRLAHRSAAAHKLHSTPQQDGINLIREIIKPAAGYRPLAYSSPEAVQTTGTIADCLRPPGGCPAMSIPTAILAPFRPFAAARYVIPRGGVSFRSLPVFSPT